MNIMGKICEIDCAAGVTNDLLIAQTLLIEALDDELHYASDSEGGPGENMVLMAKGRASMYIAAFTALNVTLGRLGDDVSAAVSAIYKERAYNAAAGGDRNV
ncbi:hypothetical protein SAMN02745823_02716 [Sporobacter termitidis DSM 10068]|uniref:Uncharacterized protein n=1 Tax=Sporobacter termitidis DSM 10068 TaxID=1123282 RepID=A0A1M5YP66_9FIRM|nr:hypothetical protein [Sporobacter termitidis]SHI13658.1 hypothetical protein SAMN02745823_02716 [Sporobacter termitidis DSM 10068]